MAREIVPGPKVRSEYDLRADQNASRRPSREMAVLIPKAALPEKGSFFPEAKLLVAADGSRRRCYWRRKCCGLRQSGGQLWQRARWSFRCRKS